MPSGRCGRGLARGRIESSVFPERRGPVPRRKPLSGLVLERERPPHPPEEDLVEVTSPPVHRKRHACAQHSVGESRADELRAGVGVRDLRGRPDERAWSKAPTPEQSVHRVGQPPRRTRSPGPSRPRRRWIGAVSRRARERGRHDDRPSAADKGQDVIRDRALTGDQDSPSSVRWSEEPPLRQPITTQELHHVSSPIPAARPPECHRCLLGGLRTSPRRPGNRRVLQDCHDLGMIAYGKDQDYEKGSEVFEECMESFCGGM